MKTLITLLLLIFSISLANDMLEGQPHYNFSLYTISMLETIPTQCNEVGNTESNIESMCAYYQHGNVAFINAWESIIMSDVIQTTYSITPVSDWLYFYNSDNTIKDIKRLYSFSETSLVASYNESLQGREIELSVGVPISEVLSLPNTPINLTDFGITAYQSTKIGTDMSIQQNPQAQLEQTQNNPVSISNASNTTEVYGSYNCEDFGSVEKAQEFFKDNGFNKDYDPYNLDGDGNGIPCESIGETVGEDSQCPAGESWVKPHTRSNGANVKGHCRKKR